MDGRFECDRRREGAADVGQAERGMIDHDVAAAFGAKAAVADLAAFVVPEQFPARGDLHVFSLPEGEAGNGCAGIAPALIAMAITHIERRPLRLNLDRSAMTCCRMCLRLRVVH